MAKKSYATINILPETKLQFDSMKKSLSADDYLCQMLNYFIVTKINPSAWEKNPTDGIMKAVGQLKAILRKIENDKIDFIIDAIRNGTISNVKNDNISGNNDTLSVEEIQALISEIERLKNENIELENRIVLAQNTASSVVIPEGIEFNKRAVIEATKELKKSAKSVPFKESYYQIEKNSFDSIISRIEEECL